MRYLPLSKGIKGDLPLTYIVGMILAILTLVVVLYPEYLIYKNIVDKTPYTICRQSVDASSLFRVTNIELHPYLKCETQQYTITKNNPELAKKTFAEAMKNCFYQFGYGEKQLFSDEGDYCFICSTIDFESKGTKIKELPEFNKYLFETKADAEKTYAEYLYKEKTSSIKEYLKKSGQYVAPLTSEKQGVFFKYHRFPTGTTQQKLEAYDWLLSETESWIEQFNPIQAKTIILDPIFAAPWLRIYVEAYLVKKFGDYSQIGSVIMTPYTEVSINKLGCTQAILQKPQ